MMELDATGNLLTDATYDKDFVRFTIVVNYKEKDQEKCYYLNCYRKVQAEYAEDWIKRLHKGREVRVRGDVRLTVNQSGNIYITVFPNLVKASREAKPQGVVAGGGAVNEANTMPVEDGLNF